MYDVVEKLIVNDSTQLYGAGGIIKKQLNIKLQELALSAFQHDAKSKEKQKLIKFISWFYLKSEFSWKPFRKQFFKISFIDQFLNRLPRTQSPSKK
jgi:hypothetical protein